MRNLYAYLEALGYPDTPTLFLDLDCLDQNMDWIRKNAGDKSIRLASKSIRSVEVLNYILNSGKPFRGLMTYDLREALWLRSHGFDDILMGYPTVDRQSLKELSLNPGNITLMVDRIEHLEMIEKIFSSTGNTANVCLDIDMSMDLPKLRFGVYRSRITNLDRLKEFTDRLSSMQHIRLTGLMGYEAQIAGVMDAHSPLIRGLKKLSVNQLRARRSQMVKYLQERGFNISLINGGGTGSLNTTRDESVVTEVTVGSGFYSPLLFDHYRDFRLEPSLFYSLPIVRMPEKNIFTCHGGGYIASGSLEPVKQPAPWLPEGAHLLKHEGAGEVQTPVYYDGPVKLGVGDSIIFRHAKAGEICERFDEIRFLRKGKLERTVKTYRGEGKTFV